MAGCAWNSPPAGRNGSSEAHLGKGSIAYADGKFYCLYEGDGEAETEIALIDASPERVERKQPMFTITPQSTIRKSNGRVWTHPVIIGGRLYCAIRISCIATT